MSQAQPKRTLGGLFTAIIGTIYKLVISVDDVATVVNNGTGYARRSSDIWVEFTLEEQQAEYAEQREALTQRLAEQKRLASS